MNQFATKNSSVFGYIRAEKGSEDAARQLFEVKAGDQVADKMVFADYGDAKRLGLSRLLSTMKTGDQVVVSRLDRLGRTLDEVLETIAILKARKILLTSIKEKIDGTKPSGRRALEALASLPDIADSLSRERRGASARRRAAPTVRPGRPSAVTEQMKAEAARLIAERIRVPEVAHKLGVAPSTLYKTLAEGRTGLGEREAR